MKLDKWQEDALACNRNLALCAGRQSGKSTVISMKAGKKAVETPNYSILIIASVERQALLLFEKVLSYIYENHKKMIKKGKHRPTKHELKLTNGSIIRCLPTGESGYGIRGYTINELYADEAAFIKEPVWAAVTPMLSTTGGTINLLSTPFGAEGYFYRAFHDPDFEAIHVNAEDVAEGRAEPQRTWMKKHQEAEKLRMTKLQYQQEYLGLFVGGIQRFIPDELIDMACVIDKPEPVRGDKFQGIDIARMGGDECPMVSLERIDKKKLRQFDLTIPEPQPLTDTARLIIHKDKQLNHKKIFMDDGGLGIGVFDILYEDPQTKRKVVGLNNASREIERTINRGKTKIRKTSLLGEDMAILFKNLLERGLVKLYDDPRIRQSLRCMQCDYSDGKLKIYGNYSHIFEALKRACWCMKDKSLNIYIY
jgi:hypothetical protein